MASSQPGSTCSSNVVAARQSLLQAADVCHRSRCRAVFCARPRGNTLGSRRSSSIQQSCLLLLLLVGLCWQGTFIWQRPWQANRPCFRHTEPHARLCSSSSSYSYSRVLRLQAGSSSSSGSSAGRRDPIDS